MAQGGCQTPRRAGNRTRLFSAACGVNTYGYCVCGAKDCNVASSRWILSFHSAQKAPVTSSASTASMRYLTCATPECIRCALSSPRNATVASLHDLIGRAGDLSFRRRLVRSQETALLCAIIGSGRCDPKNSKSFDILDRLQPVGRKT